MNKALATFILGVVLARKALPFVVHGFYLGAILAAFFLGGGHMIQVDGHNVGWLVGTGVGGLIIGLNIGGA